MSTRDEGVLYLIIGLAGFLGVVIGMLLVLEGVI
jgi:hypothetical protein